MPCAGAGAPEMLGEEMRVFGWRPMTPSKKSAGFDLASFHDDPFIHNMKLAVRAAESQVHSTCNFGALQRE
jgi:hypothetical protein